MSSKKARDVAGQHEFSLVTTATPAEVLAAAKAAAPGIAAGGLKGSMECVGESVQGDSLSSTWKFRPKGQVGGQPANLELNARASGQPGELEVSLSILNFNYQKPPLPFMKPHFPGGKQIDALRDELARSLAAKPS